MNRLLLLLLVVVLGCSSEHKLAPVSGTVTLGGKPLANASVAFQPRAAAEGAKVGPTSTGRTDDQGRFTLSVNTDKSEGATIGEHIVWISTSSTSGSQNDAVTPKELVPMKYMDGSLRYTVPEEGTDNANFDL